VVAADANAGKISSLPFSILWQPEFSGCFFAYLSVKLYGD
jgi:hypothetical protein